MSISIETNPDRRQRWSVTLRDVAELIVSDVVGDRHMSHAKRLRGRGLPAVRDRGGAQDVEDVVAEWTPFSSASAQAASMAGKSVGEHGDENDDHLTIAIIGPSKFAPHAL